MKYLLDTNVYVDALRSEGKKVQFRKEFFPKIPTTFLAPSAIRMPISRVRRATAAVGHRLVDDHRSNRRSLVISLGEVAAVHDSDIEGFKVAWAGDVAVQPVPVCIAGYGGPLLDEPRLRA